MKSFYSNTALENYSGKRVDANEIMFFTNELTSYEAQEFMNLKNELTLFKVLKPHMVEKYKTMYNYKMFDATGKSKIIAANNGLVDDIPFVGVGGKEFQSPIVNIACKIYFSDADILASAAVRRNVIGMLADQAMRSNFELMNSLGFYGDKLSGIPGIYGNAFITKAAMANDWKISGTITAVQMYQNLITIYNAIKTATNNVISPDTCLIAPALYNIMDTTIFNTFNGTTVRQQFEGAQNVKVISTPELAGTALTAGTGTANLKDSLFMFKNIESFISPIVSNWFEMKPPQAIDLRYETICPSGFGGVVIRQPMGCYIANNAT